jgi:hypothetical protein
MVRSRAEMMERVGRLLAEYAEFQRDRRLEQTILIQRRRSLRSIKDRLPPALISAGAHRESHSPASGGAKQQQGLCGLFPQSGIVSTKSLERAAIQISEPQEAVGQLPRR